MVHWKATLGILGYAVTTSSFGITFQRGAVGGFHLVSFADGDYASKATDRRLVSGDVSWYSKTQKCVTLSTTQAEYVAMSDVAKVILFLRQVWRFMLPRASMPCIPVFEDNEGAIQIAKHPIAISNSNHTGPFSEVVGRKEGDRAVSYTHLTLPTIYSV